MDIKQLCKLTREYESNIITLKLRKQDLNFYTQKWKKESLLKEIETLSNRQVVIAETIFDIAPSISFNWL